ncbi:MAG: nuclear transport factor 2 family protein [Bernardetiaceae bacterium]
MKRQQIEAYIQAYNNFDVSGMLQYLDEHIIFENLSNGQTSLRTEGIQAFAEQAQAATAYFSQRQQTITDWHEDKQSITVSIQYTATLAQDLPNGMKAGDTLTLEGKSVFTFKNEKIIRISDES